jgi:hypothetical protein
MDIHQLELFLAVMDSPSMTRAAERIHLSPGVEGYRLTRSLALATANTECPRKLTESIASFLRTALVEG